MDMCIFTLLCRDLAPPSCCALDGDRGRVLTSLLLAGNELADAGATVLLVSHRESARAIADQIVTVTVSEVMA